jgi:hypothetical protein
MKPASTRCLDGVKTNVVTAVEIQAPYVNDATQMPVLIETTARTSRWPKCQQAAVRTAAGLLAVDPSTAVVVPSGTGPDSRHREPWQPKGTEGEPVSQYRRIKN